jgi:hypothetical protein
MAGLSSKRWSRNANPSSLLRATTISASATAPSSTRSRIAQGETASVSSTWVNSATWPWLASAKRKS